MIDRNRRRRRGGTSLVEMMVFIGLTSTTLTMMSMLTHTILNLSRQMVTQGEVLQVHARLLERLARDGRGARVRAKPIAENQIAENQIAWDYVSEKGQIISYQATSSMIERIEEGTAGKAIHEQFRLPSPYRFVSVSAVNVQEHESDATLTIQIREVGAGQANGSPLEIATGLRFIVPGQNQMKQTGAEP